MAKHRKLERLIAVFLMGVLLLNIGGEMIVHQCLVFRSERFFNHQTSRGLYNTNDLTEIRIPANMPGIADWQGYEKLSGEVRFMHIAYNYIGMKMTHNAIYLLCVPNYKTTHLLGQNIIHAENMKDIPVLPKQHVPFNKLSTLSSFNLVFSCFEFTVPCEITQLICKHLKERQTSHCADIPEQPPQYHC